MNLHVYISYCDEDAEQASILKEVLESEGIETWMDTRVLKNGEDLDARIHKAILAADGFILFLSPEAAETDWVKDQTQYALEAQKKHQNKRYPIIPILLRNAELGALKWLCEQPPPVIRAEPGAKGIEQIVAQVLAELAG